MSPALMYSLPLRDRVLELLAGEVALELRATAGRAGRSRRACCVGGCCRRCTSSSIRRQASRYAASASPACRVQIGVGDDFDRLVDVIEDDQLVVEAEEQIGQLPVVRRGAGELLAFVIADRVVAGVADQAAGEGGQAAGRGDSGAGAGASPGRPAGRSSRTRSASPVRAGCVTAALPSATW